MVSVGPAGRSMYAVVTPVRSEVPVTSAIMVVTILPNGLMVNSSSHQAMTGWAGGLFDASRARVGHAVTRPAVTDGCRRVYFESFVVGVATIGAGDLGLAVASDSSNIFTIASRSSVYRCPSLSCP